MDVNTTVFTVPCSDYSEEVAAKAMADLLNKSGGLSFIKPGMKVAIKLNLISAMKPEAAGTTHPTLVKMLCKEIISKGATVILGDSPGGPYTAAFLKHVYNVTGFAKVAEELEGCSVNEDFSVHEVSVPEAVLAKKITVTNWLLECDAIINFCKLKTHGMMGMSAAMKNLFGTIPGTMKPEYHFRFPKAEDFSNMLIDLDEYWKPNLNIVDAVDGMEGNGPTAGTPRHIGLLMASESPYTLDLVGAKIIGMDPMQVPYMVEAMNRGLMPANVDEVKVEGPLGEYVISDYGLLPGRSSLQFGGSSALAPVFDKLISLLLRSKPKVKKSECVGCKECFNVCPAKAITMVDGKPVIDRDKCILCFCCQEFCPKGAMKVHRTAIARLVQR